MYPGPRKRALALSLIGLVWLAASQPAAAHPPRSFEACTVHVPGRCFDRGAAFDYGDTVVIKARVAPVHAARTARVQRLDPGSDTWAVVGTVDISAEGRMGFSWETRRADAVQDEPYLFRFRIPGHGPSNRTEAFVLFGE